MPLRRRVDFSSPLLFDFSFLLVQTRRRPPKRRSSSFAPPPQRGSVPSSFKKKQLCDLPPWSKRSTVAVAVLSRSGTCGHAPPPQRGRRRIGQVRGDDPREDRTEAARVDRGQSNVCRSSALDVAPPQSAPRTRFRPSLPTSLGISLGISLRESRAHARCPLPIPSPILRRMTSPLSRTPT